MNATASPAPEKRCFCTFDPDGSPHYVCDTHRPPPPPPPAGACVLCGHVKAGKPMIEGRDGIKWHSECAEDNS